MVKTLQALHDRQDRTDELVAAGEVIDLHFQKGQRALSARSSKLFHLLVQHASDKAGDDALHRVPIAWLRNTGLGHLTIEDFVACIRELARTTIDVEVRDEPDRAPHVKTGAFLAHVERDLDARRGMLLYEFSRTMRYILARSSYWTVLDRKATLALESRYAIRLYELMSLRAGLERRQSETFELEDLRARLGVPEGKLVRWVHLRQKAVEPAADEVNHVSPLRVSWAPVKTGRAVTGVRFTWQYKDRPARLAAYDELVLPREGRRQRREVGDVVSMTRPLERIGTGTDPSPLPAPAPDPVEAAPPPRAFPALGGISYGPWGVLVREHAPSPTPDPDLVAERFRDFADARRIPLDGKGIHKTFIGFCRRFRTA